MTPMNGLHRCNNEPIAMSVYWSDTNKTWYLYSCKQTKYKTIFSTLFPIAYCPYCGEKLALPEEKFGIDEHPQEVRWDD